MHSRRAWAFGLLGVVAQDAGGRSNDFLADGGPTQGNLLVSGTPEVWDRLKQAALA